MYLVKIIPEKIYREAEIKALEVCACGENDSIAKYIATYRKDSEIWIVQEYIAGCELFESIHSSENGFAESICRSIFMQLVDALEYIHNKNHIHGDLKPENIIFTDCNMRKIKIVDFGAAE